VVFTARNGSFERIADCVTRSKLRFIQQTPRSGSGTQKKKTTDQSTPIVDPPGGGTFKRPCGFNEIIATEMNKQMMTIHFKSVQNSRVISSF
jgi:hypothetical protein